LSLQEDLGAGHVNPILKYAAFAVITIAPCAVNFLLISGDNRPPEWDYAYYLTKSLVFYSALRAPSLSQFISMYNDPYRPPFVSLAALPFYAVFGTSYLSAMMANLAFLFMLAVSTYQLGKRAASEAMGLVLTSIVVTLPGIMTSGRIFGLDFALTVIVTASVWLAIACEGFNKRGTSVALGIALGLGMLTKWTFLVFAAPVVVVEIVRYRRRINLKNAIVSFALFFVISSTWYLNALKYNLVIALAHASWGASAQPSAAEVLNLGSFRYYPSAILILVGPVLSWTLILLAIVSIALLLKRFATRHMAIKMGPVPSLLSCLLASILIFTLLSNKQFRFIVPALPVFLSLLVLAVWKTRIRVLSLILIVIAISGSCISLAGALYPQLGVAAGIYHEDGNIASDGYSYEYSLPDSRDWHLDEALEFAAAVKSNARVAILADHWVFNQDTFEYYSIRLGLSMWGASTGLNFLDYRETQIASIGGYDGLSKFDIVFVKTGSLGIPYFTQTARVILARLSNPNDPFYLTWKMAKVFDLPDGSQLKIYTKNTISAAPSPNSNSTANSGYLNEGKPSAHTRSPTEVPLPRAKPPASFRRVLSHACVAMSMHFS
jgi:hypothetical protein